MADVTSRGFLEQMRKRIEAANPRTCGDVWTALDRSLLTDAEWRMGKSMAVLESAFGVAERLIPGHKRVVINRAHDDGSREERAVCTLYHPLSSGGQPRWQGTGGSEALAVASAIIAYLLDAPSTNEPTMDAESVIGQAAERALALNDAWKWWSQAVDGKHPYCPKLTSDGTWSVTKADGSVTVYASLIAAVAAARQEPLSVETPDG